MSPSAELPDIDVPRMALPGERFYLPELDTLRFFAFLAVFLHHSLPDKVADYTKLGLPEFAAIPIANAIGAGMFGVDLFFVLSSFLITTLLVREYEINDRIDIKRFWIRRCLRIWPLYFVFVVLAGFLLPPLFHFVAPPEGNHVVGLLTFTQNWSIAFSDAGRGSPTLVLWSVSLEEQFYLVWPVLIAFAGVRRLRSIAIGMVAFSVVARLVAIPCGASWFMLWCATPLRLEPIAVGALIAIAHKQSPSLTNTARVTLLLTGVTIPVLCMKDWLISPWQNALVFPFVAVASGFILVAIRGSGWMLFSLRPLVYLGTISYGLYVFHSLAIGFSPRFAPEIPFGKTIAALLLTIVLAVLSYRFVERPFLRLKSRFAHVQSRPT